MNKEIYKELLKYNENEAVRDLKELYASPSNLEILGIDRIEAVHSNFIAWLIENQNLAISKSENPFIHLLDIIIRQAIDKGLDIDYNLVDSVLSRDAKVISVSVDKEVAYKDNNNDNRIDLIVNCVLSLGSIEKSVVIYLENKVEANETYNKMGETGQTKVYYEQYHDDSSDQIQLFVFLSPNTETQIECEKFIRIDYQSILEKVLEPLLQTKLKDSDRLFIQNYIRALGVRVLDNQGLGGIMAITKKEKELFTELYKNYKELYKKAFLSKVVKKYWNSSSGTKKNWKKIDADFGIEPDDALVMFWNENKSFIRTAVELCETDDKKKEILENIQKVNKDTTNYKISIGDSVLTKSNTTKGHIAKIMINHYVTNYIKDNKVFKDEDELKTAIEEVFGTIRKPIVVKGDEKRKSSTNKKLYDEIEIGNMKLYIPNDCWGAGTIQFSKLLKRAEALGYKIVPID